MKILMLTTYYHPHISGLTLYFQRLAEEYVKLGHEVTMLTAQHDKSLKTRETISGVKVIRTPYIFKINKGMVLAKIWFDAWRPIKEADIVHINLPSVEALPVAILSKILRKPVVSTYVCDITLPKFFLSGVLDRLIDFNHYLVLKLSDTIASFTLDFAKHSRVLVRFVDKTKEVYPIVELPKSESSRSVELETVEIKPEQKTAKIKRPTRIAELGNSPHPRIGMATRIAADKGIDYMVNALPHIWEKFPDARLFMVGTINAVGEEKYLEKLQPLFEKYAEKIRLLGSVAPEAMPYFFRNIDVLVVASTNSTEAFGMVQVEAMFEGTPCVATDLPGVRVPIQLTKAGKIAKIADSEDLAKNIIHVLEKSIKPDLSKVGKIFSKEKAITDYLDIYENTITRRKRK